MAKKAYAVQYGFQVRVITESDDDALRLATKEVAKLRNVSTSAIFCDGVKEDEDYPYDPEDDD